jgi:poly(A) polymerase
LVAPLYESLHILYSKISDIISGQNIDTYVIGGFVRDVFLQRANKDIDIVTTGDGIELAKQTAQSLHPSPKVSVFKNFGTAMFKYKGVEYEFVGTRKNRTATILENQWYRKEH